MMSAGILRFLGPAGIAGAILAVVLSTLLVVQKGETRHWHKQSDGFEKLYHNEQAAFARTVANYRAAAEQARKADAANAARVAAEQKTINERTSHDFETRLAAARAAAERMRHAESAANPSGGGTAPVPGLHAPAGGSAQASSEDGFSIADRLTATEQAIQLDELIKWVKRQAGIDVNRPPATGPSR